MLGPHATYPFIIKHLSDSPFLYLVDLLIIAVMCTTEHNPSGSE
jgi:hypothetical protein